MSNDVAVVPDYALGVQRLPTVGPTQRWPDTDSAHLS